MYVHLCTCTYIYVYIYTYIYIYISHNRRLMCSDTSCTKVVFIAEAIGFFGLPLIM